MNAKYTKVPNIVLDALIEADMGGADYKMALTIIRKTYGFHTAWAWITYSLFARITKKAIRTCQGTVYALRDRMIVFRAGSHSRPLYQINENVSEWVMQKPEQPKKATPKASRKRDTTKRKEKKETIYRQSFLAFWKVYPNKKAKQKALKAWIKLGPADDLVELILEDVKQKSTSRDWTRDNGDFIPHPATYLNGKRWEDEDIDTNNASAMDF